MLSKRLKYLCELSQDSSFHIYDLCCDHGQLGIEFLRQGFTVTFVDQVPSITTKLQKKLNSFDEKKYEVITDSILNLKSLRPSSVIYLCGVGSKLAVEFLEKFQNGISSQKIIIAAHGNVHLLIKALCELKITRLEEDIIEENGRFYEIFICEKRGEYGPNFNINKAHFNNKNSVYTQKQYDFLSNIENKTNDFNKLTKELKIALNS